MFLYLEGKSKHQAGITVLLLKIGGARSYLPSA